jgi:hypothetical protein
MTIHRVALITGLALLGSAGLIGQTVTGSLVDLVVDRTGSVIPDVRIQLTNEGTSTTSTAVADSAGLFRCVIPMRHSC